MSASSGGQGQTAGGARSARPGGRSGAARLASDPGKNENDRTSPLVKTDRLDHVHLSVRDRPAAIDWYNRILGLRVFGQGHADVAEDHPVFLAPATSAHHCLSLFVGPRPEGGDRNVAFHASAEAFLAFAAALPVDDLLARTGQPLTAADHNDYGLAITFDFLDPAGNHLELVTYDFETARAGLR